jgi:hypothetical protein
LAWRIALSTAIREAILKQEQEKRKDSYQQDISESVNKIFKRQLSSSELFLSRVGIRLVPLLRALFEFALPIFIGVFAVYILMR